MSDMERFGIYGGTFSPIHAGHIRAAEIFLNDMRLDRLLIMPAAVPPHKAADGVSGEDRLEMARIAFKDADSRIEVSDFEVKRDGKSYTICTLENFTEKNRTIFLLVGTDMFLTLPEWRRSEDIFKLANIVLMRRESEGGTTAEINEKRLEYTARYGARIRVIEKPPLEVSSTMLRARIKNGEPTDGLIPDGVAVYIKEHGLYMA